MRPFPNVRQRRSLAGVVSSVLLSGVAQAGDWMITPRFSVAENYSDNIFLSAQDEQQDFVTQVTPGLSLRGRGARVSANVDYNLQNLTYVNEGDLNRINHQLQSGLNVEVVRDVFFVDASAARYQALISSTGAISNRNFQGSNNRTDVMTYSVRPSLRHHFGTWADLRGSTAFSDTSTDSNVAGGGRGQQFNVGLSSGRRFTRLGWDLSYHTNSNNYSSGQSSSALSGFDASGSWQFNRKLSVQGKVGFENNRFGADNDQGLEPTWSIGGTYTPSPVTSISGRFGHRSFGSTKSFDFSHRRRRLTLSGSYSEELRTSTDILREQQLVALADEFGNPIFDPLLNSDFAVPTDTPSLTDNVFVHRRLAVSIGYQRRLDYFSVGVFRNDRESQVLTESELATGTSVSWRRTMSRRLSAGVSGSFQSQEGSLSGFSSGGLGSGFGRNLGGGARNILGTPRSSGGGDFLSVTPYVSYTIGPHVSSRVSYSYSEFSADQALAGYQENSVQGSLSFAF